MPNAGGETDIHAESTTVFFSYSRVDQLHALPIIDAIEAAGYKVWWDGMLEGGTDFLETTEHALETAKAVVVLWSKTSVTSHWVRDEATSGRVRERLIPLTLDGTIAPLGFRQVQLIDFQNWPGDLEAPNMQELSRTLAAMHGENVARPMGMPHIPLQSISPSNAKTISRRSLILAGTGAVAIAGIGGLGITGNLPGLGSKLLSNGIAVLPFRNSSGDPVQDFLSGGLSSDVRTRLAKNEALRVVSRSSSESVAKEGLSAQNIAKRLSVANILDGMVQRNGDKIQVTAELIDGKTGFNVWTHTYDHKENDALSVRNHITQAIISNLTEGQTDNRFDPDEGETQNPVAYDAYLKGVTQLRANTSKSSNLEALEHFNRAIQTDPKFGAALTAKALLLLWLSSSSSDAQTAKLYAQKAKDAASDAVLFSPKMADAYSTLGYIQFAQLNIEDAKIPYERSQELGLNDSISLTRYASFMAAMARDNAARKAINRAIELDPLNITIHRTAGFVHYAARRYDEAINANQRVLNDSPKHWNSRSVIGLSQFGLGQFEQGLASCTLEENPMERLPCLAIGYQKIGQTTKAEDAMAELIATFGDAGAYQQVQVLSEWGRSEEAMARLHRALELKDSGLTLAKIDPALDPLRDREDFRDILDKIGFST